MNLYDYIHMRKDKNGRNLWGLTSGVSQGERILFEHVWKRHDHKNIVELGTWYGVTALYLGMLAMLRGGSFISFDKVDFRLPQVKRCWLPNMNFYVEDVLKEPNQLVIRSISGPNTAVFIDNGDKTKETLMYAEFIKPGGIILIHDWVIEIDKPACLEHLGKLGYSELYGEIGEMVGSWVKCFIRR